MRCKTKSLCRKTCIEHFPAILFRCCIRTISLKTTSTMYHVDYHKRCTTLNNIAVMCKTKRCLICNFCLDLCIFNNHVPCYLCVFPWWCKRCARYNFLHYLMRHLLFLKFSDTSPCLDTLDCLHKNTSLSFVFSNLHC